MPTGVSSLYYPEQSQAVCNLVLEDSYYLLRLHDTQALFEAGWLKKAGYLIFSSSVESSLQPRQPTQSLQQITALEKNEPCRLGISANLTDWLPARAADSLKVTLKYTVVQDTPFKELVDQMGQIGLAAKLSLVRPELAVGVKVSEITGRLLSYLLREGSRHEVFSLMMDLNLADLKTGYYAVLGSQGDAGWPTALRIDANGRLTDLNGHLLLRHSYAVIQTLALPRRGQEIAREQAWWELLQAGKDQALGADLANWRQAFNDWKVTLAQVRILARKERGYLLREIDEIIRTAQVDVEDRLLSKTTAEAKGLDVLPDDWQDLLGVRTEGELRQSVQHYQDAVAESQRLIGQYQLSGSLP